MNLLLPLKSGECHTSRLLAYWWGVPFILRTHVGQCRGGGVEPLQFSLDELTITHYPCEQEHEGDHMEGLLFGCKHHCSSIAGYLP